MRANEGRPRGILVLYRYGKDFASNVVFERGLQSTFREAARGSIEYFSEYLESNRFPGEAQSAALRDYLLRKYADQPIDVVVAPSRGSLDFLLKHRAHLFQGVPIVYYTFGPPVSADEDGMQDVTGIAADRVLYRTLDTALGLHPATTEVLVIVGTAERDRKLYQDVRHELAPLERRATLTYLIDMPLSILLTRVKEAPPGALVLYVRDSHDEPGHTIDPYDMLRLVAASASVPVYSIGQAETLGSGTIGGWGIDYEGVAAQTGRMALTIANGASPSELPLVKAATIPRFDWRQLRRWGIGENRLPPGSVVMYREPAWLGGYRPYVLAVAAVVALQFALIGGLLAQHRRRRRAEESLAGSQARNAAILRAIPDLMFVMAADGTYIDYHARDERLLFVPPDQFLGKNVRDIMPPGLADRFLDALERVAEAHEPVVVEYTLPLDGDTYSFEARLVASEHGRILSIVRDITVQRRADARNRDLTGRLIAGQEAERQRIARELHDDLGQKVALLSIDLEQAGAASESDHEHRARLSELSARATEIARDVHDLSRDLHPSKLQTLGLVAALQALCRDISHQHNVAVEFVADRLSPAPVHPDVSLCLYRIAQEALRNVVRHSGARRAAVRLTRDGADFALRIRDEGLGFTPRATGGDGLGLLSMRERAAFLGGRFAIHSTPGTGTEIDVRVPAEPGVFEARQRTAKSA